MKNHELRITNYRRLFVKVLFSLILLINSVIFAAAQSTNQSFPTTVGSNEISGTIRARDIGDSRLTSHFYAFNGAQGDVFINVVTSNFNGDIDVFTLDGLRPLTKIVVFADSSAQETGRVIYLRKPEKLLLRVEGRTPNDDAATYRIKFAGSFQAISGNGAETEEPKLPVVSAQPDSGIVVNSVGTIIAVKPKPTPSPVETAAKTEPEKTEPEKTGIEGEVKEIAIETDTEKAVVAETNPADKENLEETKKPQVVVTENVPPKENPETVANADKTEPAKEADEAAEEKSSPAAKSAAKTRKPKAEKPKAPNPLENVRLIILFKDGSKIERPMSEISRVNVDNRGMLTVVSKDGSIGRYSILEVAKFTIE